MYKRFSFSFKAFLLIIIVSLVFLSLNACGVLFGSPAVLNEIKFFTSTAPTDRSSVTLRDVAGKGLNIQDELSEPLDGKTVVSTSTYGFSEFKFVTDIFLKADHYFDESNFIKLLGWGGDTEDLSKYIDLIEGRIVETDEPLSIPRERFDSLMLQINAPGETINPAFGSDVYPETKFSWGDIKPYSSTDSTAQTLLLSTYVETPMVKWVEGPPPENFNSLQTVQDYNTANPDSPLSDLGEWAYNAPLNQEFFATLESLQYTEDPLSGEAWVILPLNEALDFSAVEGEVVINFEFFLDDMMEVHHCDNGTDVFMLSSTKTYVDTDGKEYYSPFPVKIGIESTAGDF